MSHVRITIENRVWFDADIDGFQQPPTLPANPTPIPVSALPDNVRDLLDKALLQTLERVGIKVTAWERVDSDK